MGSSLEAELLAAMKGICALRPDRDGLRHLYKLAGGNGKNPIRRPRVGQDMAIKATELTSELYEQGNTLIANRSPDTETSQAAR